jgi:hypothetical protein
VHLEPLDALLEIVESGGLRPVMGIRNEVINLALVVVQEGLDVFAVEEGGSLGSREDQVQVEEESQPGVEWYPAEDEVEGALEGGDEGEGNKVHEPWGKDGGVGGVEGFVGGEDGEEDGYRDAESFG